MELEKKINKIPRPIIHKIRTNTIKMEIKKYKLKKKNLHNSFNNVSESSNGFCDFYKSRLKMLKSIPPSHSIQDINTIKWLKRTHNKDVIRACVNKMLDDDDEEKLKRKKSFSFDNKYSKDNIQDNIIYKMNPKYFWTKEKFKRILKLKELFKEFDIDDNQQMEINEIESMFKTNNIDANSDELTKLFNVGMEKRNNNKGIIFDFYQFCNFSIEHELEFSKFLRSLKLKETIKKDSDYYPRSFNSLLDYFISKGEERKSVNKIKSIIKNMDIIRETNPNYVFDFKELIKDDKKMDFYEIMSEFKNLFQLTLNDNELQRKRRNKEKEKEKEKEIEFKKESRNKIIKHTSKLEDCKGLFAKIIKKNNINPKNDIIPILPLLPIEEKNETSGTKIKRRHFNSCIYIPPKENL
jgi:hypothetical protein